MDSTRAFEALRLTFEEMAFLDVADGPPVPGKALELGSDGPVLFLAYTRPKSGAFVLAMPKELKFKIAEAIFGEEAESLSAEQLDDSLLELMNVLAGRLLTLRYGDSSYAMGLPTVQYDVPDDLGGMSSMVVPVHVDSLGFALTWYEVAP